MTAEANILGAEPQIFVTDLAVALTFFSGGLGFETAFVHGEPAFYAQVRRGRARINLRQVDGPIFDADLRAREPDILSVTILVDRIERLFADYEARNIRFHQRLRSESWGARSFIVVGPDANLIAFAGA